MKQDLGHSCRELESVQLSINIRFHKFKRPHKSTKRKTNKREIQKRMSILASKSEISNEIHSFALVVNI